MSMVTVTNTIRKCELFCIAIVETIVKGIKLVGKHVVIGSAYTELFTLKNIIQAGEIQYLFGKGKKSRIIYRS